MPQTIIIVKSSYLYLGGALHTWSCTKLSLVNIYTKGREKKTKNKEEKVTVGKERRGLKGMRTYKRKKEKKAVKEMGRY